MKDSIKNFVDAWHSYDQKDNKYRHLGSTKWNHRFRDAGYIEVIMTPAWIFSNKNIEAWCNENVGTEHYAWVGDLAACTYWFENEETALQFSLRWL